MAIPFKSYLQPVVVMSAIPFGLIGAFWGHVLMGKDLTILSMFGIIALTGVVVNDSIVLMDFINVRRREGASLWDAVHEAGPRRFRPILLTSLTTVAGLTPMLLERSVQAQFLIPIAISLAFGVLFATFIILIFVPTGVIILDDLVRLRRRVFARLRGEPAPTGSGSAV
jgi:multidrug efflux pump subunit AcrB